MKAYKARGQMTEVEQEPERGGDMSHPISPGASPGALTVEGQAVGAGGLAPRPPRLLVPRKREERLEEEIRIAEVVPAGVIVVSAKAGPSPAVKLDGEKMKVWDEIEEACSPLLIGTIVLRRYGAGEKETHTYTAFKKYLDLAFTHYSKRTRGSLERVKKVCREAERKRVVDYVVFAREVISELENSNNRELKELASWLANATFSELMSHARGVVELMKRNGYVTALRKLAQLVDDGSRLSATLFFEAEKIVGKGRNSIALLS